ncbi:hypothetical protein [Streptomyces sp. NPDC002328]
MSLPAAHPEGRVRRVVGGHFDVDRNLQDDNRLDGWSSAARA